MAMGAQVARTPGSSTALLPFQPYHGVRATLGVNAPTSAFHITQELLFIMEMSLPTSQALSAALKTMIISVFTLV
jgi:hypothetical protein